MFKLNYHYPFLAKIKPRVNGKKGAIVQQIILNTSINDDDN